MESYDQMMAKYRAPIDVADKVVVKKVEPNWSDAGNGTVEKSLGDRHWGRLIHGLASSSKVNANGYMLVARGAEVELPVPLLFGHKGHAAPIGEIYYVRKSHDRLYVRAEIFSNEACDHAWRLITSGEVRCFSGAGRNLVLQGVVDDKTFYGQWKLHEVSVCRQGANPDSKFEIMRDGDDGRQFFSASAPAADEPALPYRGTWDPKQKYQAGDFVTKSGSLWHSQITSTGLEPGKSRLGWKLAVKRGQAERLKAR